jgi:hypothetical protein
MSYEQEFLSKLEAIITANGGEVPAVTVPTSFEQRSLELLDAIATAGGGGGSAPDFESSEIVISAGDTGSVLHGLGGVPHFVQAYLKFIATESGYSEGDYLPIDTTVFSVESGGASGMTLSFNDTHLKYQVDDDGIRVIQYGSGSASGLTLGNVRLVIRAWR